MGEGDFALAVGRDDKRANPRQFEALLHHGFGNAEARGDVGGTYAVFNEGEERLEFIGGMHLFQHGVFDEADFRGVHIRGDNMATDCGILSDGSRLRQREQGPKSPASGDDGIAPSPVLAHDKRLQKAVRGDGRKSAQRLVGAGPADVAGPRSELVQGNGGGGRVSHGSSPSSVGG
jgi:hypothetical protein